METRTIVIIQIVFRVIAAVICTFRARNLNRSQTIWGIFGFIFPVLAVIAVFLMKNKIAWHLSKNKTK
jgi:formate hydrogenlyase subunit 3/multisubunit Na+/H+ antiporter MnhD subunit